MFTARDQNFSERVRESFGRQGFMAHLGARLLSVAPGRVEIEVDHSGDLTQQHGFFHAGVTSAIADSAGGYAGFTLFPPNSSVLTVEFKMNLIAPAAGTTLRAAGQVVRSGRTLTFCNLEASVLTGRGWTLCATGQQTLMCLIDRPDR